MQRWGILLLIVTATAVPAAAAPSSEPAADAPSSSETPVTEIRTYNRTPATDGSVRVTVSYDIASEVDGLCVRVPSDASGVEVAGFNESAGYCSHRWDGETATPTMSFALPVETRDDSAPGPFVETDDWALVRAYIPGKFRTTGGDWTFFRERSSAGEWSIERRVRFAGGDGTAAESLGLMGPARTDNWTEDGEQFRVVSPRAGNASLDRYRPLLSEASRDLRVGNRGNVTVVALTERMHAGSASDDVMLVPAGEEWPFEYTRQTWIHEYVHTRQSVAVGDRMGWFVEASASYYDLLLAHHQGEMTYAAFEKEAAGGRYPDAVLANRSTWQNGGIPYERGPRVLAALDARIRNVTDGTRTFADVFYLLNRRSDKVSYSAFKRDVATVAGRSLDAWLDRYFMTNATPPMPDDGEWVAEPQRPRDFDDDGLSTAEEKRRGLNPFRADSNADGVLDGEEPDATTRTTTQSATNSSATTTDRTATAAETVSATPSSTAEPPGATTPGFGVVPAFAALIVAMLRANRS